MGIVNFLFKKQIKKISENIANIHISNYRNTIKATYGNHGSYNGMNSGAKWPGGLSAPGSAVHIDHYTTRQNVRSAIQDSTVAKSIVSRYSDTIADTGIRRESTPNASILGITPKKAEEWAENVDSRFDLWAGSKKQHRSGLYTFYQSHRLYASWIFRDNDIFTRLFYSQKRTLLNPLQFDFIEPNQIRGDAYTSSTYQTLTDYDGIIRNPDGTEKAFKVWLQIPGKYEYKYIDIPAIGPKSGKKMMLHGFSPEYAGQGRGFSPLAGAIQEFQDITDFKESIIKKAIAQSSLAIGVENEQLDPSNPLESISFKPAGPTITDTGEAFVQVAQNTTSIPNYSQLPEATLTTPGSVGVFNLQRGDKMKIYENKTPAESLDSFLNSFVSYVSASVGMPIEMLLIKFNASYSALRGIIMVFWRIVLMWRAEMAADYLDPTFEMWLSEEIAAGRVMAPGWSDPILRAAWLSGNWVGSPMPQADPVKAAKANEINVKMGLTTLDRESSGLNGSVGKTNRAKLKKEYSELPPSPFGKGSSESNESNIEGEESNG